MYMYGIVSIAFDAIIIEIYENFSLFVGPES